MGKRSSKKVTEIYIGDCDFESDCNVETMNVVDHPGLDATNTRTMGRIRSIIVEYDDAHARTFLAKSIDSIKLHKPAVCMPKDMMNDASLTFLQDYDYVATRHNLAVFTYRENREFGKKRKHSRT